MAAARHGSAAPRGQDAAGALAPGGRFGSVFGLDPCDADDGAIVELFELMRANQESANNGLIPAGFTYLAQFVDHDITFDPLSDIARVNDPGALVNFRTPRLDLDSVYGSGPRDQPFLYEWKSHSDPVAKLLVNEAGGGGKGDLPRSLNDRAIIGDARNDEHVIIAQLHLLFIRFHNAVVDHLREDGQTCDDDLFSEAQRLVRWHYQWIVTHEVLCKFVELPLVNSVLEQTPARGAAPAVHLEHYRWDRHPFIPLEFSGAIYRFGHSMVRGEYRLTPGGRRLTIFPDLEGFGPLADDRVLKWKRFFQLDDEDDPQPSRKIDRGIAAALFELPDGKALPLLNLRRGIALGLPSGQAVADAMHLPKLDDGDLLLADANLPTAVQDVLLRSTPLWYYVLCEAQAQQGTGGRLGPLAGQIVAEVLVGLLQGDPNSYLRQQPTWRPNELLADHDDFTIADLIRFTDSEA